MQITKGKKIGIVMGAALLIGILVRFSEGSKTDSDVNQLKRNEPGRGDIRQELLYGVEGAKEKYSIQMDVEERSWTKEEWNRYLVEAKTEIERTFLAGNESAEHVSERVNLCESAADGAIEVEWSFEPENWIDAEGNIMEENLADGQIVLVSARLSCGEYESIYEFPVSLYIREKSSEDERMSDILQYAKKQDKTKQMIQLPDTAGGERIIWYSKHSYTILTFLLLGAAASLGIVIGERYEQTRKRKNRDKELLADYPEIVSQLGLLLTAGMSLQQAWKKMVGVYEKKRKQHWGKRREGYEEMCITLHELGGGVGEIKAFERFGERCGLAQYRRLASVLTQNMRKGMAGIGRILNQEAENAFEQRKNTAHRMGEEAGTKLLFPMMLMLVVVMVILVVPACMTMNI